MNIIQEVATDAELQQQAVDLAKQLHERAIEIAKSGPLDFARMGAGIGAGIVGIGVGLGIGKIGAAANEGIARQPEATADIRGISIILAALIEGVCLLGVVVTVMIATS